MRPSRMVLASRMVMRVMTLMHMFEMTLALALGLAPLW